MEHALSHAEAGINHNKLWPQTFACELEHENWRVTLQKKNCNLADNLRITSAFNLTLDISLRSTMWTFHFHACWLLFWQFDWAPWMCHTSTLWQAVNVRGRLLNRPTEPKLTQKPIVLCWTGYLKQLLRESYRVHNKWSLLTLKSWVSWVCQWDMSTKPNVFVCK